MREQYHQRPVGQLIDYLAQEIDRGNVRPVAILDQEEQGFPFHAPLDQSPCGQHDLALELLGLDFGLALALQPEHVAQYRGDGLSLGLPCAERAEAGDQLPPGDVQRVRRIYLIGFPEECSEDAIRRLAQGGARGPAHGCAAESAVGLESREKLRDEPRFARACLADQAHNLGTAMLHPVERGHQPIELVGTPDERRRQPEHFQAPR